MTASKFSQFFIPAQSSTYALMLVESHADTIARTAKSDSGIYLTVLDCKCTWMSEIGVVTAIRRICSEILISDIHRIEISLKNHFHFISCMIAAETDRYVFL